MNRCINHPNPRSQHELSSSHHINQRWSSNSYSNTFHKGEEKSSFHDQVTIAKQGRYTFSSSSFTDRYDGSHDKPIRRPLRRLSLDSNTSSSISTVSSKESSTILRENISIHKPIRLPMYVSFNLSHADNDDNLDRFRRDIHEKQSMPPKYPKRKLTIDNDVNNIDNCNNSDDVISKSAIISSRTKSIKMSTLKPRIRRCCHDENNNMNHQHNNNNKMNDNEIQAIKRMIGIMDDILYNNNKK